MADIGLESPEIVAVLVKKLQAFAVAEVAIANWDLPAEFSYNDRGAISAKFHDDLIRLPEVEVVVTKVKRTRDGELLEKIGRKRTQSGRDWKTCADWIWLELQDVVNSTVAAWQTAAQAQRQKLRWVKELRNEIGSLKEAETDLSTELRWLRNGGQQWNSARISWSVWLNAKQILSALTLAKEQLLKDGQHAVAGSKKSLMAFIDWLRVQTHQRRDSLMDLPNVTEVQSGLINEAVALDAKLGSFLQSSVFANTEEVDLDSNVEVFLAGLAFDFEVNRDLVQRINRMRIKDLKFATADTEEKSLPEAICRRLESLDPISVELEDFTSYGSFQSLMPVCVREQVLEWSASGSLGSQIANHWDLASVFDPQARRLDTFTDKMGPLEASYDQAEALDQANVDLVESMISEVRRFRLDDDGKLIHGNVPLYSILTESALASWIFDKVPSFRSMMSWRFHDKQDASRIDPRVKRGKITVELLVWIAKRLFSRELSKWELTMVGANLSVPLFSTTAPILGYPRLPEKGVKDAFFLAKLGGLKRRFVNISFHVGGGTEELNLRDCFARIESFQDFELETFDCSKDNPEVEDYRRSIPLSFFDPRPVGDDARGFYESWEQGSWVTRRMAFKKVALARMEYRLLARAWNRHEVLPVYWCYTRESALTMLQFMGIDMENWASQNVPVASPFNFILYAFDMVTDTGLGFLVINKQVRFKDKNYKNIKKPFYKTCRY